MKIRFSKSQIVDTNELNTQAQGDINEKAQIAEDVKGELDDNSSSYEDQTQLNLMKRIAIGFLKFIQNGSGDGYLREFAEAEFADLANDSGIVPWDDLIDAIQYDEKAEEEEEPIE